MPKGKRRKRCDATEETGAGCTAAATQGDVDDTSANVDSAGAPGGQLVKGPRRPQVLALDCEMAGWGPKGKKSVLVRVSIVGRFGKPVFDCLVKPSEEVTDWREHITGIDASSFPEGGARGTVRGLPGDLPILERNDAVKQANDILDKVVVVGHDLRHDFSCLKRHHQQRVLLRDTAFCSILKEGSKRSSAGLPKLRDLARDWLEEDLHGAGAVHDSVGDAQTAMLLYRIIATLWETTVKKKWGDVPSFAMEDGPVDDEDEENEDGEEEAAVPTTPAVSNQDSETVPDKKDGHRKRPKKRRRQ